jgi:rubrerythrin
MAEESRVDEFTHIPQALSIALEREKRAYEFYRRGAEEVEDAGVKTLFAELAAEEKNHITRIQD